MRRPLVGSPRGVNDRPVCTKKLERKRVADEGEWGQTTLITSRARLLQTAARSTSKRNEPSLVEVIARVHDEIEHSPLLVPVLRQHSVGLAFLQRAGEALYQRLLFRRRIRLK